MMDEQMETCETCKAGEPCYMHVTCDCGWTGYTIEDLHMCPVCINECCPDCGTILQRGETDAAEWKQIMTKLFTQMAQELSPDAPLRVEMVHTPGGVRIAIGPVE